MDDLNCEWNPDENDLLRDGETPHSKAVWVLGSDELFNVCDSCSKNDFFADFKIRRKIEVNRDID